MGTLNMREHILKVTDSVPKFCLDLFEQFIVNDSGSPRNEMIKFIKECMIKQNIMTPAEQKEFFYKILETFLTSVLPDVS